MYHGYYSTSVRTIGPSDRSERGRSVVNRTTFRFILMAVLSLPSMLGHMPQASAQVWQYVYGPANTLDIDYGRRGVRPTSLNCSGVDDGYIAVGTSVQGGNSKVYVVRTNNGGSTTPGWERAYNVASNSQDYGESIVELVNGSGYAIAGYTLLSSGTIDVLVMKIACDGSVIWARTLGTSAAHEYGYDIIQATNGDLLVAGRRDLGSNAEGLMIRLNSANGNVNWYRFYDQGTTSDEGFYTLTEVEQVSGSDPDIIAVGRSGPVSGSARRGMVVRTSSSGAAQGAAIFGGGIHEEFYSVIELQNPAQTGTNGRPNVVIAGFSNSYNSLATGNSDMYFVKLDGGDICLPLTQRIIGQPISYTEDVATCVREIAFVPASGSGLQQWDIAVTGWVEDPSMPANAILATLSPIALNPAAAMRTFGHPTNGDEKGWSLHPVQAGGGRTEGFILCGSTTTLWHIGTYGDIADLYMVKTDNAASLGNCEFTYMPEHPEVQWPVSCLPQSDFNILNSVIQSPTSTAGDWDDRVCTDAGNDGYPKRINAPEEPGRSLTVRPNPLNHNQPLLLTLTGFDAAYEIDVKVTNLLGEEIASEIDRFTPSTGEILVKTTGWPAGVYHVTVWNGDHGWTTRVVVLE